MGVADDDSDDNEDSQDDEIELGLFNPNQGRSFVAFSKLKPKKILDRIIFKLLDDDIEPELDREKMRITFSVEQKLSEDDKDSGISAQSCEVEVKLLRHQQHESLTAIVFTRLEGDSFLFAERFQDIQDLIVS